LPSRGQAIRNHKKISLFVRFACLAFDPRGTSELAVTVTVMEFPRMPLVPTVALETRRSMMATAVVLMTEFSSLLFPFLVLSFLREGLWRTSPSKTAVVVWMIT
jgi:hypothetical protein